MRALDVQTHRLRTCKGIFAVFLVALGARIPLRLARNLHACIPRVLALDFVNPFSHAFHFFSFPFQQQRSKALAAFHSLSQGVSRRQAKRLQLFIEWAMRSWSAIQLVQQSSRYLSRCTSISRAKRHAVSTSRNASLLAPRRSESLANPTKRLLSSTYPNVELRRAPFFPVVLLVLERRRRHACAHSHRTHVAWS